MKTPSLGWQSWSPPLPSWHGFPRWDYSPFPIRKIKKIPLLLTKTTSIRYWCSWYAYGWEINDLKINKTLRVIKENNLDFTHLLLDDGWTTWGDWHKPNLQRFPNLRDTVKTIKAHKLRAGIWFAPFLASSKSHLFKEHPEYFVTHRGRYVQGLKTFPVWESILPKRYLLNTKLPEVKNYLTNFIDLAVKNWGFDLIKLDFLYAPYFDPNHTSDKSPHSQITWLLKYIRTNYPNTTIVACGAPFAPSIKLSHAVRISKDTALPPNFPIFINKIIYNARVKMLAIKIAINRLISHQQIDPDVRIFALDSPPTSTFWDTISTSILGVGDDLSSLTTENIERLKVWLSSHISQ